MPTDEVILQRKRGREAAAVVADLAQGEVASLTADARVAFWEELTRRLPLPIPAPPPPTRAGIEPFTDAQARAWGKTRIPFGKHIGRRVDEIDLSYLEMIAEPTPFATSLRRYLASHRVACEEEMQDQNSHENHSSHGAW